MFCGSTIHHASSSASLNLVEVSNRATGSFVDVQGQFMPVKCLKSVLGEEAKLEQFTSLMAVSVLGNQLPSGKIQVALSLWRMFLLLKNRGLSGHVRLMPLSGSPIKFIPSLEAPNRSRSSSTFVKIHSNQPTSCSHYHHHHHHHHHLHHSSSLEKNRVLLKTQAEKLQ